MRGVRRSLEPVNANLSYYRLNNRAWSDLAAVRTRRARLAYRALIIQLQRDFSRLCAYCERKVPKKGEGKGTIDHFRPRNPATGTQHIHFGTDLTFEWMNMMYTCADCQANKDNKWPGTREQADETAINNHLATTANNSGWTSVPLTAHEGYVNPNLGGSLPPEDFFAYTSSRAELD